MIYSFKENYHLEHKISPVSKKEHYINHMHLEWELYYLVNGSTNFFVNNTTYQLKAGDLLLIKPTMFHFSMPKNNEVYERILITFPNDIIPPFLLEKLNELPSFFSPHNSELINTLFMSLSETAQTYSTEDAAVAVTNIVNIILLQLKYYHSSYIPSTQSTITNPLLKDILDYIENNIFECSNLEDLAKHFYISTSWLSHTFKQNLNISPKQYINFKKILHAQKLIHTGASPSSVYQTLGFNDYSTFYRLYKKFLKNSPQIDNKKKNKNK
ncbi:MAG: AraC family transcriptional regulator [Clostridiales bacterium]|nr:AraC family transcriptional regulator [Clostridiales bacterium]